MLPRIGRRLVFLVFSGCLLVELINGEAWKQCPGSGGTVLGVDSQSCGDSFCNFKTNRRSAPFTVRFFPTKNFTGGVQFHSLIKVVYPQIRVVFPVFRDTTQSCREAPPVFDPCPVSRATNETVYYDQIFIPQSFSSYGYTEYVIQVSATQGDLVVFCVNIKARFLR